MSFWKQLAMVIALLALALPVGARFFPGSHPWLASLGLLEPMRAAGLVPAPAEGDAEGGPRRGGGGAVRVIAAEPQRAVLRDVVTAIGSARGAQSVALTPAIAGRIVAIRVAAGDLVPQGAVIAELDSETARLAMERAELVLADAQATVARLDRLAASGAASDLQRQDAALALRTAELGLRSAEHDLSQHQITAPVGGVVGLMSAQVGDQVGPTTEVTRIEDRSSLIVDFRVPERVAALIRPGDAVDARPLSDPGRSLTGRISAIDNRVDEASRSLRVQAAIANTDDSLRSGMAFRIALEFTGATHPSVDPLAIQWGSEGAFVWIVRDGKATRLPIRILQRNAADVLVEADLRPGDMVVTEGVQALRPGAEVEVVSANPKS
jgi:RND family efflux transporter MFP subunit